LEFEIDQKKELIYAKIDRKKRILGTLFLRALGYDTREKIIDLFYKTVESKIEDTREYKESMTGKVFGKNVFAQDGDEKRKVHRAGDRIHPHNIDELIHSGITSIQVIDESNRD